MANGRINMHEGTLKLSPVAGTGATTEVLQVTGGFAPAHPFYLLRFTLHGQEHDLWVDRSGEENTDSHAADFRFPVFTKNGDHHYILHDSLRVGSEEWLAEGIFEGAVPDGVTVHLSTL